MTTNERFTAALSRLVAALKSPGQPETLFRALQHETGELVGHKLFSLLRVTGNGRILARTYTSNPQAYPVGGTKEMGPTPWGTHVIEKQQPYLGRHSADIRWAFFDHELIASLGCASVINIPVRYDGRTVGVVNLLHQENWYRDEHIPLLDVLCALLVPAFLEQP